MSHIFSRLQGLLRTYGEHWQIRPDAEGGVWTAILRLTPTGLTIKETWGLTRSRSARRPWVRGFRQGLLANYAECGFPGEAAQVGEVRRFVAEFVNGGWPDADEPVLLASELATNAVVHSASGRPGGKFTVRVVLRVREYVWIEVQDQGGAWAERADDGEHGRGLGIVAALAEEWGRDGTALAGWIVWARLTWPHDPGPSGSQAGTSRAGGLPGPAGKRQGGSWVA